MYHVTEPGYQSSEHCPRCGSFATKLDEEGIHWRCQRTDCRYEFTTPAHPSIDPPGSESTPRWTPGDSAADSGPPTCASCGTVVSEDYRRVFAGADGVLEHCFNCASRTQRYSNDPVIDPSDPDA
jgi:hypothetical protein